MKRYITPAIVLLLVGMLVSCGGGGGDTPGAGASPGAPNVGNPAGDNGGNAGNDLGGNAGNNLGGNAGNDLGGDAPLPSAGALVQESDAAVTLSPGWTPSDGRFGWSGGTAKQTGLAGETASFTFTGTSVTWIGRRSTSSGIALVRVDGGPPTEVNLYAQFFEVRTPVLTLHGLSDGRHTLTIEVTGRKDPRASSSVVVVDAFGVQAPIVSHLQETDPDVSFSAGWMHLDNGQWSGGGVRSGSDPAIGGARVTETAGASVTLKFRGTAISWIGYRGPDAGIARVQLDGRVIREVNLYSKSQKVQEVVFTASGLADAPHTLTIEATGGKDAASTAARVVVDAFDVMKPGRRFEDSHPAITYTGEWTDDNVNRTWSEGVAAKTDQPGARATFSFTGTSVSFIGCEKSSIGSARIYIDGAFVKLVNMNRPVGIEGYQRTIFRADGLTNGPHTLTIEAFSGMTVVDAFDVHP